MSASIKLVAVDAGDGDISLLTADLAPYLTAHTEAVDDQQRREHHIRFAGIRHTAVHAYGCKAGFLCHLTHEVTV